MSTSASDPFAAALAQLQATLPVAPPGYRYRLIGQWTLCGLLIVCSLLFLICHYMHARRSERTAWMVRLQKKSGTRRWQRQLTINSIPFFALTALLAGIGLTLAKWGEWKAYILGRGFSSTVASFSPWLVVFIQAWTFSLANLEATLTARSQLITRAGTSSSVCVHNFALLVGPVIVLFALLPMCAVLSQRRNAALSTFKHAVNLLKEASAAFKAGQQVDMTPLVQFQRQEAALVKSAHDNNNLQIVICIICIIFLICIMLMNIYSLFLVVTLRMHAKAIRDRRNQYDLPVSFTRQRTISVDCAKGHVHDDAPTSEEQHEETEVSDVPSLRDVPPTPFSANAPLPKPSLLGQPSTSEQALQRLASDLSYAVPLTIFMCGVDIASLASIIHMSRRHDTLRREWTVLEFVLDTFAYSHLTMTTVVICFFGLHLYKSWRNSSSSLEGPLFSFIKSPARSRASEGELRVLKFIPSTTSVIQDSIVIQLDGSVDDFLTEEEAMTNRSTES